MKRFVVLALILALLVTACGCKIASPGSAACEKFMVHIQTGDYGAAWDMLSASVKNDSETSNAECITKQEFIDKYTNIFSALEITSVTYENVKTQEGDILTTVDYTGTYLSTVAGALSGQYRLVAVREGGKWCIEWSPALIFPEMEWGDTVRMATLSAERGEILAGGAALAATADATSVYAVVSRIEDLPLATTQLARLLSMTEAEVTKKLDAAYNDLAIIKQFYSGELSETAQAQLCQIPGVGVDVGGYGKQREYPYGSLLAHTIGYVGPITGETASATQLEIDALNEAAGYNAYAPDSRVGKLGLESQYETELRGKDGMQIFIATQDGQNRRTLYSVPAEDGWDIQLTIDLALQQRVEEVMGLVLFGKTTAGAVVVLNPLTGEVQAMASYPSYDLNLFNRGISSRDYSELLNNAAKPLINRVTQGRYPPGSVFKAFTAAATLDNSVISTDYVFNDRIEEDYWAPSKYGNWIWPAIKRTEMRNRTEPLNMHNAILNSDNIYFAYAALELGEQRFMAYMDKLGFEETVPFDIGVAAAQMHNKDTELTLKMLADSGYGQGELLMTPLQLAAIFTAFANGGDVCAPRIVQCMCRVDGIRYIEEYVNERSLWKQDVISDSSIDTITPMLKDVVRGDLNGTGRRLGVTSCTVAAKTGTAEIGEDKSREIAWFAGFRTDVADEDARLVLVMLEVPAEDAYSELKFDIARELLKLESKDS